MKSLPVEIESTEYMRLRSSFKVFDDEKDAGEESVKTYGVLTYRFCYLPQSDGENG